MPHVPNQFPRVDPGSIRLAIVGEAPSLEEESWRHCARGHQFPGEQWRKGSIVKQEVCPACGDRTWTSHPTPFVGPSGRLLDDCLRRVGFDRARCFIGNVSQFRRFPNELNDPGKLAGDLEALSDDLQKFRPNIVLCLGNTALRALHPWHWRSPLAADSPKATKPEPAVLSLQADEPAPAPKKVKRRGPPKPAGDFEVRITDWRGSFFEGQIRAGGWQGKCLASFHPAAILRGSGPAGGPGSNPEWLPLLRFDLQKAIADAGSPELRLPKVVANVPQSAAEAVSLLQYLAAQKTTLGHDIEGGALEGVTDFSFAQDKEQALWIPLKRLDGSRWWTPEEEQAIMEATRGVLEDPAVPKVVHSGTYESFVWKWAHGITLQGIVSDTLMAWHELMPELDKSLDVPASILTRQPYWKYGLWAETEDERAEYNCTDSCVTLELHQLILPRLTSGQLAHYQFNVSLLPAMVDQMLRGIRFDLEARRRLVAEIDGEILEMQGELDVLAGIQPPDLRQIAEIVCYKKAVGLVHDWPDVLTRAKPSWKEDIAAPAEHEEEEAPDATIPF